MPATLSEIAEELTYLEQHHKVELQAPLAAAIKAKDAAATAALLNRAYKAEIERRLEGGPARTLATPDRQGAGGQEQALLI